MLESEQQHRHELEAKSYANAYDLAVGGQKIALGLMGTTLPLTLVAGYLKLNFLTVTTGTAFFGSVVAALGVSRFSARMPNQMKAVIEELKQAIHPNVD